MIRLASYNVENLFSRAKVLNQNEWAKAGSGESRMAAARDTLNAVSKLNALLAEQTYTSAIKDDIIAQLATLDLLRSDETKFVILRRNRGKLLKRPKGGGHVEVVADGRSDWIGWVELKTEAVDEVATQNTARVIGNIKADIVAVVEAENRTSLIRFGEQVLQPIAGLNYDQVMLIDGNDDRGIDVGLLWRAPITMDFVRSHVGDRSGGETIFSRDCPEFHMQLPNGDSLIVLVNHFKSKGFGTPADSNRKRKAQAQRVRDIYDGLTGGGARYIAVVGDLNDTPDSDPLSPLVRNESSLRDITEHPSFVSDGRPGTYANGTAGNKIDYILLSPDLFAIVKSAAIYRAGVWGGTHGTLFPHLPEITNENQAASDHAALYVDLDLPGTA